MVYVVVGEIWMYCFVSSYFLLSITFERCILLCEAPIGHAMTAVARSF